MATIPRRPNEALRGVWGRAAPVGLLRGATAFVLQQPLPASRQTATQERSCLSFCVIGRDVARVAKPTIIPNWKYQKPSKGGYRGLKKLLKYVSHRESPDHRPVENEERWTDCGLGQG